MQSTTMTTPHNTISRINWYLCSYMFNCLMDSWFFLVYYCTSVITKIVKYLGKFQTTLKTNKKSWSHTTSFVLFCGHFRLPWKSPRCFSSCHFFMRQLHFPTKHTTRCWLTLFSFRLEIIIHIIQRSKTVILVIIRIMSM